MAITRIGAATVAGTSLTPSWSGAGAGEIEIAWAYRSGNATPPSLPSGWVRIKQEGANTNSGLLAYRFCPTSANVATGTFTNATQLIITRYKGCKGIGNVASSAVSSNSISYPALTMVQSDGNSWIFGAGGHRTATNVNTAPSGMTNITSVGNICAVHDTNAGVSSWGGASASVNANSGHESMTIELLADGGAWSIYDSNDLSPGWSLNTQNKVAQRDGAVGSLAAIRQFTGRSTGKWAVGFRQISFGQTFDLTFGLVTGPVSGGQSLTAWPDSGVTFVFDTDTAAGNAIYYDAGSQVDFGSGNMIQAGEYGSMCVDLDAGKFWICHQSMTDWNNDPTANPNAGTGGISYTTGKGSTLFLWHSTGNQGSSFAINTFTLNDVAPIWTFPANASDFQPWDNPATAVNVALTGISATAARGTIGVSRPKALTGISATGAVGTVSPHTAYSAALSGVAATGSPGTLGSVRSKGLTGSAATGQAGSLVAAVSRALAGFGATGASGTLTPSTAYSATLSGVSATGAVGSLVSVRSLALDGEESTGATGDLTPFAGFSVALIGIAATASTGTLRSRLSKAMAGVSGTGAGGTLTPFSGFAVALVGVSATAAVGAVGLSRRNTLTGVQAIGIPGTLAPSNAYVSALSGVSVTTSLGSIRALVAVPLTGVAVTTALGTLSPTGGIIVISPEWMITPRPQVRMVTPAPPVRMITPRPRIRTITAIAS